MTNSIPIRSIPSCREILQFFSIVFAAALIPLTQVKAQNFPSKPIQFVVPYAAGASSDAIGRIAALKMSDVLGQPIIIDNRVGASGAIGTKYVASAKPDGYTILLGQNSNIAANPVLIENLTYDPIRDLSAVARLVSVNYVLAVSSGLPARSVTELVAYLRQNPGKSNYASTGTGVAAHLIAADMVKRAGLEVTHVPYNALGQALGDLSTGTISFMVYVYGSFRPLLDSGKIRFLAVTGPQRETYLPDTPTMIESGFPNFVWATWNGIYAPAGTPAEAVNRIADAAKRALVDPGVLEKYRALGVDANFADPKEFDAITRSDIKRYSDLLGPVAKKLN